MTTPSGQPEPMRCEVCGIGRYVEVEPNVTASVCCGHRIQWTPITPENIDAITSDLNTAVREAMAKDWGVPIQSVPLSVVRKVRR